MIFGIGNDIVEVYRVKKATDRAGFLRRVFSDRELLCCKTTHSLAGNFATKEAFSKAIGTGIRGFKFTDVEVLRDDMGKPYIELSGGASEIVGKLGINNLYVSISHCREYATAVVVAEKCQL